MPDPLPVQALVDHGLAVVQVNYRGSTGYGREWRDALTGNPGLTELEDIAAVHDMVIANGIADPERIVISGASWGGYESLVLPFNAGRIRSATSWQPEGPTIRLHIGLEDVADLKADLEAGFARLAAAS